MVIQAVPAPFAEKMIFVPHSCQRLVDCIYRGYFWAPYPAPLTCLFFYHYHTVLITAALQSRIVGSSDFAVSAHFLAPLPLLFKHRCCHEPGHFLSAELSWIQGSAACQASSFAPKGSLFRHFSQLLTITWQLCGFSEWGTFELEEILEVIRLPHLPHGDTKAQGH